MDDEPDDRKLAIKYLKEEFPHAEFVEIYTQKQFYDEMEEGNYDVVLTDYQLHWTNGIKVLREVKKRKPFTPLIMLTESETEEIVVEAMKSGLDDYVLKTPEHIVRLPAAVRVAIEKEDIRKKERMLYTIVENAKEAIVSVDAKGNIIYINKATEEIFGWKAEELIGKHMSILAIDSEEQKKQFKEAIEKGWARFETIRKDRNGNEIPLIMTVVPFKDEKGNLIFSSAIMIDIREIKEYEQKIEHLNEVLKAIRDVNQLITKEKKAEKLLKKACEKLTEVRDYDGACILYDDRIYVAGDKKKCKKVLKFIKDKGIEEEIKGKNKKILRKFNGVYFLAMSFSKDGINILLYVIRSKKFGKEEVNLLKEICGDIIFALYTIKVEKELREEEKLTKTILSASPVGIGFTINRILGWANDTMYEMTGYTPEETLGKSAKILYENDEEYERVGKEIEKAFKKGEAAEIETKWKRKDGSMFDCYLRIHPINPKKPEEGTVVAAVDITELKKAKENLEAIFNSISDPMLVMARDHTILDVNPAVLKILGKEKKDIIGKKCYEIFHEIERAIENCPMEKLLNSKKAETETVRMETVDGIYMVTVSPIFVDGEITKIIHHAKDITELKQLMKALEESEEKYRILAEHSTDGIFLAIGYKPVYANPALLKILGVKSFDELKKKNLLEFLHPEDAKEIMRDVSRSLKGEIAVKKYEVRAKRMDGKEIFIDLSMSKVMFEGQPHALGIVRDVTERKKLIEELKESEEKYRAIVEQSHDAIYIYRGNKFLFVNDRVSEITGYSKEELYDVDVWELIHPDDREKIMEIAKKRMKGEQVPPTYEARVVTKEGEIKQCEFAVTSITYGGKYAALGVVRDVTERRKMEEALIESEEKFRNLVENAYDAIYIITPEGFEYVNPAFEKLTGYTSDELTRKEFNFWSLIHPDDIELIREREKAREEGKKIPSRYEFRVITKDGKTRIVEVATVDISTKGKIRVMGILRDITERRKAEEEIQKLSQLHYVIGMNINRSESIEQLCKSLLKDVKEIINIEYANIFIYNENKKILTPVAYVGYPEEIARIMIKEYFVDDKQPWEAVKACLKGKERYIKNVQKYKALSSNKELYRKYDIRELYTIPLISRGKIQGIMQMASTPRTPLTEDKRRLLKNIAEEIAAGIAKIMVEEELKKSEEKYRTLVTDAAEGIYRTTIDGEILEINPAVAKMFGYTQSDFLKIKNVESTYREPEKRKEFIEELMKKGAVKDYEIEYIRRDGRILIARESARLTEGGVIEGIMHDVTKERLYREKLEALAEVSSSLLGKIEIEELYDITLRTILRIMDADGGIIFECDGKELQLKKAIGISKEYVRKYKTIKLGEHLVGKVAKTKEAILVVDSLKDDRSTVSVIKSEKYRSAIVVPVLLEEKVFGVIGIISRKPQHFTGADVDTLQTVANHLASAINVANMHQQLLKALEQEREFKMRTAHYFFNPIAIAKGYLELAIEGKDGKEKILKAIEAINRVEKVIKNVTQKGEIHE